MIDVFKTANSIFSMSSDFLGSLKTTALNPQTLLTFSLQLSSKTSKLNQSPEKGHTIVENEGRVGG